MMVCQLSLSACRTSFLGAYSDMTIGMHKVNRIYPLSLYSSCCDRPSIAQKHQEFETNLCFSSRFNHWPPNPSQVETGQLLFRLEPPRPYVEPVKGWNPFNIGWLDQSHVWVAWKNYDDTALPYSICILDIVSEEKPVFFEKISWDGGATNWNSLMLQTRHDLLFTIGWSLIHNW